MADRTSSKKERAPVTLTPATRAALNDMKAELERVEGRRATHDEIVGALVAGVPLWQADLMLRSYTKQHIGNIDAVEDESEG